MQRRAIISVKPLIASALLLLVASGMIGAASAKTVVGGELHGENRWDAESGPYIVESDIIIPRYAHLTIAAGTQIVIAAGKGASVAGVPQFDALDSSSISIKVEGALMCVGKKNKRISFVPAGPLQGKLGWYGIIFNKVSGKFSEMAFTDVAGAYNGVTVYECKPLIRTTVLERNNIGINCLRNGSALVYNCIIANNFAGGIRVQEANPHIANSIIIFNKNNGLWCDGRARVKFEYNCLFGNSDGNFLDCDPELGRLVRVNKRKDSVDYADNLYGDPVFAGGIADSIAFARDVKIPTDKSKLRNVKLAEAVGESPRDSSFAQYRLKKRPRFALSRYSPCVNAGNPARRFQNSDGARNSMGIFGGPDFMARENE
jgi:hypothetical protein